MFYSEASWTKHDSSSSAYIDAMTVTSYVNGDRYTYPEEEFIGHNQQDSVFRSFSRPIQGVSYGSPSVMDIRDDEDVDEDVYEAATFQVEYAMTEGGAIVSLVYYDAEGERRTALLDRFWAFRSN